MDFEGLWQVFLVFQQIHLRSRATGERTVIFSHIRPVDGSLRASKVAHPRHRVGKLKKLARLAHLLLQTLPGRSLGGLPTARGARLPSPLPLSEPFSPLCRAPMPATFAAAIALPCPLASPPPRSRNFSRPSSTRGYQNPMQRTLMIISFIAQS